MKMFLLETRSSFARPSNLSFTCRVANNLSILIVAHHLGGGPSLRNTQLRPGSSLPNFAGEVSRHRLSRTLVAHSFLPCKNFPPKINCLVPWCLEQSHTLIGFPRVRISTQRNHTSKWKYVKYNSFRGSDYLHGREMFP